MNSQAMNVAEPARLRPGVYDRLGQFGISALACSRTSQVREVRSGLDRENAVQSVDSARLSQAELVRRSRAKRSAVL